ncbi:MAG: hypothetical protein ACREJC_10960 [Tepidisphaeraceae bacterium]
MGKAAEYVGESPGPGRVGSGRLAEVASQRRRAVAAAEQAGAEVKTTPIIRAGEALTEPGGALRESIGLSPSGAQRTVKRFIQRVSKERQMTSAELRAAASKAVGQPGFRPVVSEVANLSPRDADVILQNTKFFSGARDIPGAETAGRTLRAQLSRELKRAVPAVKAPMAEQQYLLPVQRALDRALARGGSQVRAPAIYLSGGRPRMFGVLAPTARTTFGVGKALSRLGGPLGASPTAQRLLPGSLRALLLQLAAQDWPPP